MPISVLTWSLLDGKKKKVEKEIDWYINCSCKLTGFIVQSGFRVEIWLANQIPTEILVKIHVVIINQVVAWSIRKFQAIFMNTATAKNRSIEIIGLSSCRVSFSADFFVDIVSI